VGGGGRPRLEASEVAGRGGGVGTGVEDGGDFIGLSVVVGDVTRESNALLSLEGDRGNGSSHSDNICNPFDSSLHISLMESDLGNWL